MHLLTRRRIAAIAAPAALITVLQAAALLPAGTAAATARAGAGVVIPAPKTAVATGAPATVTASSRIVYPGGLGLTDYATALAQEVAAVTGT
ncbi:hypothetical protein P3T36_007867 [Kitasatospora sp. MAP12-15]|uniref:hypothetical protein n=1 Tax=unclassified Kitasatospora TaxID=2633591 RepID=UPI0024731F92|nr:hypothetical protein [Kitasatospora sp. MAP12-44]MDH6115521.1 hypothetical protein [Kitasatospora sp. MAP12-44]